MNDETGTSAAPAPETGGTTPAPVGADTPELAAAAGLPGASAPLNGVDVLSVPACPSLARALGVASAVANSEPRAGQQAQAGSQSPPQRPTLSRDVHYILPEGANAGQHRAAKVTSDFDGVNVRPDASVNLTVFYDQYEDHPGHTADGAFILMGRAWSVPFDPTGTIPGTWHWPERA